MKEHLPEPQMRGTRFAPFGWLLLGSIVMASIQAQLPDLKIGVHSIRLTWAPTDEECIVVCAESPDGPWTPVPVPIREVDGKYQAVVRCSDQQRYFRLAKGVCFMDDFDDGLDERWRVLRENPPTELVTLDTSCGTFRVVRADLGYEQSIGLDLPDATMSDFAVSVDILDWDPTSTSRLNVVVVGRLTWGPTVGDLDTALSYSGVFCLFNRSPGRSPSLYFMSTPPRALEGVPLPLSEINPPKPCRLVCSGFGGTLRIEVFDLATGELIGENECLGATQYTDGITGFGFGGTIDGTGTIDITVDNVIIVGTTP